MLGLQAGFHCLTCPLCGMTYAPGEEVDEKLHAAHHAKLVQGIRFQVGTDVQFPYEASMRTPMWPPPTPR